MSEKRKLEEKVVALQTALLEERKVSGAEKKRSKTEILIVIPILSCLSCSLCFVLFIVFLVSLCSSLLSFWSPHPPTGQGRWLPLPDPDFARVFFVLKGSSFSQTLLSALSSDCRGSPNNPLQFNINTLS